jgi:predicted GIY-YIG superfamily endonuclease
MFLVYVLENSRGKFYVGQTQELAARMFEGIPFHVASMGF